MGLGMVATAGAGFLSLAAMMNTGYAHADDIGLVLGGSSSKPHPGDGTGWIHHLPLGLPGLWQRHRLLPVHPVESLGEGVFTPRASTR